MKHINKNILLHIKCRELHIKCRKWIIELFSIFIHVYISDSLLRAAVTNVRGGVVRQRGDDKRHHRLARRYDGEIHNCHHF